MRKSACLIILIMAVLFNCFSAFNVSAVFDENTNMAGWRGLESGWTSTSSGYKDGSEQTVFDVAVSDVTVDGSKNFTYTAVTLHFKILYILLRMEMAAYIIESIKTEQKVILSDAQ